MKRALFVSLLLWLAAIAPSAPAQEAEQSEREAMYRRYLEFASYVKGGSIQPHWMADGSSFWYAEGTPANTVIYKVDPANGGTKTPLFDTARLRRALIPLLGHEPPYQGLPFEEFNFTDDSETAVRFTVEGKEFFLQLDTYTISRVPALLEEEKRRRVSRVIWEGIPSYRPTVREALSPDGRWIATVKDHNLWLRSTLFSSSPVRRRGSAAESPYHGRSVQLTTDGVEDFGWGGWYVGEWAWWSPSSYRLAVIKEDYRKVPKFPIVHYLNPREEVDWLPALDTGPRTELFIVDIVTKRQVRVDTGQRPPQWFYVLGWRPDGSELLFLKTDLEKESLDLMAANPATGSTRVILTEERAPFRLWREWENLFTLIADGTKFIWRSDRDSWNQLYLYDLEGNLIRRLTEGAWPVIRVVAVDEKGGWVYFIAQADVQRPYDTHLYRVDVEGKNFKQLTQAHGQHTPFRRGPEGIQFPPSREFFLDTHSNVDRPPAVELRRADGTLLQTLSRANIDALREELKWSPPEEFVVKAADGKTDLYGILYKPYDFDPNKKYPVIEVIYGGYHTALVPHTFIPRGMVTRAQALAQQGFITFIVDARGTPYRGRAFQEVGVGNADRHVIPDHVAALKQLAEKRPYMDLSWVGIRGHSYGGYWAIRAMLLAPDVYRVGVAKAPMTHFLEDRAFSSLSEKRRMGEPHTNKEAWDYASNLRFAGNLRGKLLLIHGTSDPDVTVSHTMKMVDALIRAGKRFDLLIVPGVGHSFSETTEPYLLEVERRYFQEHLKP